MSSHPGISSFSNFPGHRISLCYITQTTGWVSVPHSTALSSCLNLSIRWTHPEKLQHKINVRVANFHENMCWFSSACVTNQHQRSHAEPHPLIILQFLCVRSPGRRGRFSAQGLTWPGVWRLWGRIYFRAQLVGRACSCVDVDSGPPGSSSTPTASCIPWFVVSSSLKAVPNLPPTSSLCDFLLCLDFTGLCGYTGLTHVIQDNLLF